MAKKLILGVGSILRHDDGIGSFIIEKLKQHPQSDVDYLNGGTDGLALLDIIKTYDQVILIDAVNMDEEPGTIKIFKPSEVNLIQRDSLSTHTFGIAMLILLMKELAIQTELTIIGIQPQDISFGEGLTEIIQSKIKKLMDLIVEQINVLRHSC